MRFRTILLIILASYFAYDVFGDLFFFEGLSMELLLEATMFFAATTLLAQEIRKNKRVSKALLEVTEHNQYLSSQLNELIESKFVEWKLTKAESETAWFLIKGFSINEIADLRNVSDKTVHHQLTSIYSKSDTRNRSEFVSKFIQKLFDNDLKNYPA